MCGPGNQWPAGDNCHTGADTDAAMRPHSGLYHWLQRCSRSQQGGSCTHQQWLNNKARDCIQVALGLRKLQLVPFYRAVSGSLTPWHGENATG